MENTSASQRPAAPSALEPVRAVKLADQVSYEPAAIVSRTIARSRGGSLTLFAFDAGQELAQREG